MQQLLRRAVLPAFTCLLLLPVSGICQQQRPNGSYAVSFYSSGSPGPTTVRIEMEYTKPGETQPTDIDVQFTIPANTSAADAAALTEAHLENAGVDANDCRTGTQGLVWVLPGVSAAGLGVDGNGLKVNGETSSAKKKDVKVKRKNTSTASGPFLTQLGSVEFSLRGFDVSGLPASDRQTVTISSGLNETEVDALIVTTLTQAGWDVTLTSPGEFDFDGGPTVTDVWIGGCVTRDDPGFIMIAHFEDPQ